jgi:hypothetical protein
VPIMGSNTIWFSKVSFGFRYMLLRYFGPVI